MTAAGAPVHPELVDGWEQGIYSPSELQLFILADVLWCSPAVLMGVEPRSLREHRLARHLSRERLASQIGMSLADYARAEERADWKGSTRQTRAVAMAFGLSLRQLVCAFGRTEELTEHLRACVKGRWKPHVTPVSQLTAVSRTQTSDALRTLHTECTDFSERYMGHLVARSDDARLKQIAAERSAYLRRLVDHFWELIGEDKDGYASW